MITFKNKYDGSLVMSQQTHAQEVTSHFPVARLVTIGHFQSEQSLVVVAQWEEHALSVSPVILHVHHLTDKGRQERSLEELDSLLEVGPAAGQHPDVSVTALIRR